MSCGRVPLHLAGMISVKVDNLNKRTTPISLWNIFKKYGEIGDVYIPREHLSKKPRGFGFVRFYKKRHAQDAIVGLDGIMLDGHVLRVHMARYGRLPNPHGSSNREIPAFRYQQWSRSQSPSCGHGRNRNRSRSPREQCQPQSQGEYHSSYEKSPSLFQDTSPSTTESTSTASFNYKFSLLSMCRDLPYKQHPGASAGSPGTACS